MSIDLSKYNIEIHPSLMSDDYAFDIQKAFERRIKERLEEDIKEFNDPEYHIQSTIDSYKGVMYFVVTEEHSNNIYRGRLVKKGGSVVRDLDSEYYFRANKKCSVGELVGMFDNLSIVENIDDIPKVKDNVEVPASDLNDIFGDSKDEFNVPPVQSNDDFIEYLKVFIDMYQLDKEYLRKLLKSGIVDMKMYSSLKDDPNRDIILKALSFYDEMRSDKKVRVIETSKARQKHEDALNTAASHYEIDPRLIQQWIGRRNGFASRKL